MWEIQHVNSSGHWENVWRYDNGLRIMFETYQEALCELALFFEDLNYAMSEDHGYRHEDFRIVWVEEMVA